MKRNWYAVVILLMLCLLLLAAGRYVDRTTEALVQQVQAAYALAMQGNCAAARRAYGRRCCRPVPRRTVWRIWRWRHSAPAHRLSRCGNHFSAGFERLSSISFSSSMKVLTSLN